MYFAPMIQRATLEDDSKHYIAYNRYSGATGDDAAYKAKFSMFTPAYEITSLNQDNHEYRILGFNVFNIENETYLALNDQQADTWSDLMMQVMISSVYSGVNGLLMLQVITLGVI